MTKTKMTALALAAMTSLSALGAMPQPAQAFGRGIAVGEFNPSRPRFDRFDHGRRFDRFDRFRRTERGFRGRW